MPYDSIAAALFASHPKPFPKLEADVVDLGKDLYSLRFYRVNIEEFSDDHQATIAEWAKEVLNDMNKLPNLRMVWDVL